MLLPDPKNPYLLALALAALSGPLSYHAIAALRSGQRWLDRQSKTTKRMVLVSLNALLPVLSLALREHLPTTAAGYTPEFVTTLVGSLVGHVLHKTAPTPQPPVS